MRGIIAAAVAGMLAGCAPPRGTPVLTLVIPKTRAPDTVIVPASQPDPPPRHARPALHQPNECRGRNACKGQGNCKTDNHDCKGKNECKGQGGCRA
jgi:hypothetical protein